MTLDAVDTEYVTTVSMSKLITKLFRKNEDIITICPLVSDCTICLNFCFILYNTIQYNTIQHRFISNREHNYTTTAIFTKYWDGWKGGGQKNNIIVVHPLIWLKSCRKMHPLPIHVSAKISSRYLSL